MSEVAGELAETSQPRFRKAEEGSDQRSRWRLYVVAFLVFVVLAGAGVFIGASVGDDRSPTELFRVDDQFDRTSGEGLGEVAGRSWEAVTGSFGIEDGAAVVETPNDKGPRTIAVTDLSATNGTVNATAGRLVSGWGIVFRYVGPFNYWYLQAVPEYAVFNVVRVVNGDAERVGTTRLARLEDGMSVKVVLRGPTIEVQVGDKPVFATNSSHGLGARKAGLIAVGDAAGASWRRFWAEPDRLNPGPEQVTVGGGSTGTTVASSTTDTTAGAPPG